MPKHLPQLRLGVWPLLFLYAATVGPVASALPAAAREAPHSGVVLVAHGLNLKPSKMQPLADTVCNERTGLECRFLILPGHDESPQEQAGLPDMPGTPDTLGAWKAAILEQVRQARAAAGERPLYFLGYSVGGLAGAWVAQQQFEEPGFRPLFNRMVLIAPPIETRWMARLLAWLPGPDSLGIPSLNHESYRMRARTPLGQYRALYALQDELSGSLQAVLNSVPALVLVNPEDEMVSLPRIQRRLARSGWGRWSLEPVGPIQPSLKPDYQHLTIDEPSMGPGAWLRMQRQILEFFGLLNDTPDSTPGS